MEELKIKNRIDILSARKGRDNSKIINKLKRKLYKLPTQGDEK